MGILQFLCETVRTFFLPIHREGYLLIASLLVPGQCVLKNRHLNECLYLWAGFHHY